MYDFRGGEVLSNQQAQDVALGGPGLTLVNTGTLSLIQHSHGFSLSFRSLVHLPSSYPFPLAGPARGTHSIFFTSGEIYSTCV